MGELHQCAACQRATDVDKQTTDAPPVGRLCGRCASRWRADLHTVVAAWEWLRDHPGVATGTNSAGGSEPQLPGGTGRLSYLGYGQASPAGVLTGIAVEQRAWIGGQPLAACTVPTAAIVILADFAAGGHSHPDIGVWCTSVAHLAGEGAALCGWSEQGQWVTCPTETSCGECGRRLRIDMGQPDAPVVCRWCQRTWTALQLLNLAMHSDGWADPASAAEAAGVTEHQVRVWTRTGRVEQRNSLVSLADVQAAKTEAITAAHIRLADTIGLRALDQSTRCPTCGEWAELEADSPGMADVLLREWRQMHTARHAAERPARRA